MIDLVNKELALLERLIDDRCDMYGIRNTISFLMDNNFTKEELIEMEFDEKDIDAVMEDPDACWSFE